MRRADEYLKLPYEISLQRNEEGDWSAWIEALEGCVAHGDTELEALERLRDMQRAWIEEALAHGQTVPEPEPEEVLPSGKWVQRVPRSLHKRLTQLARREGTSLNQLVANVLAEYLGGAFLRHQVAPVQQFHINIGQASMGQEPAKTVDTWRATGLAGLRVQGEPNTPNHRVTESRFDG